jgi:hypothetical protein
MSARTESPTTFDNSTGPTGRRRRKQNHRPQATKHNHDTRANRRNQATTAALEIAPQHVALHGNAFNPDTGKIAEYPELSRCSKGKLWQKPMPMKLETSSKDSATSIPQLLAPTPYFSFRSLPSQKAAKPRIFALFPRTDLKRRTRGTYTGPLMATVLSILAM